MFSLFTKQKRGCEALPNGYNNLRPTAGGPTIQDIDCNEAAKIYGGFILTTYKERAKGIIAGEQNQNCQARPGRNNGNYSGSQTGAVKNNSCYQYEENHASQNNEYYHFEGSNNVTLKSNYYHYYYQKRTSARRAF